MLHGSTECKVMFMLYLQLPAECIVEIEAAERPRKESVLAAAASHGPVDVTQAWFTTKDDKEALHTTGEESHRMGRREEGIGGLGGWGCLSRLVIVNFVIITVILGYNPCELYLV